MFDSTELRTLLSQIEAQEMTMKLFLTALVTALAGTCAQAQPVRTERNISLELASQLASDAMAA